VDLSALIALCAKKNRYQQISIFCVHMEKGKTAAGNDGEKHEILHQPYWYSDVYFVDFVIQRVSLLIRLHFV
jgi:hypothetical protein